MRFSHKQLPTNGFTLLELLIVVVILSTLAAIVIPSFMTPKKQMAESFIRANEKIVQNSIDRYQTEHGFYPLPTISIERCPTYSNLQNTSQPVAMQNFINNLKLYSSADGHACNYKNAFKYPYGPYLSKSIPANPLCGYSQVYVYSDSDSLPKTNDQNGWAYNYSTGEFTALKESHGCTSETGQGSFGFFIILLLAWRVLHIHITFNCAANQ